MSESQRRYHHGNLKDALIIAAAELIETQGTTDFSITDAANRAGVSNAAPYRHFRDKLDLLEHVKELAFLGLHETLVDAREHSETEPSDQQAVISLGLAYLRFAREKQRFFSLMWEQLPLPDVTTTKASAFYVFLATVSEYIEANRKTSSASRNHQKIKPSTADGISGDIDPAPNPLKAATQLWALAHGLATLEQNDLLNRFDRLSTADELLVTSATALLAAYTQ
ncbi:MAG: TetR/AcrR family transcriptional regulator [Halieaceae bacterium]|jgi:AcrR family transcriptional regulator